MKTLIWMVPVVLLCSCAGSRCRVTALSVEQPVSCTACVLDSAGRIRAAKPNEVVSHFVLSRHQWSMLYRAVPLSQKEWDISPELKAKLEESSGNAIVNVRVSATGCDMLHWYLAALVPILPSYINMKVEGDVVRISDAQP